MPSDDARLERAVASVTAILLTGYATMSLGAARLRGDQVAVAAKALAQAALAGADATSPDWRR